MHVYILNLNYINKLLSDFERKQLIKIFLVQSNTIPTSSINKDICTIAACDKKTIVYFI